jgi:hypothetical protein
MKKNCLSVMVLLTVFACLPARAQSPAWFDVPVVWAPTGGPYTCVTRPTGDARIAIITCDPSRFNGFPIFAQKFLIAHEHGHVYQIVYNPSILYGPYAEYDADCYGAEVLAGTDVASLTATVHWFETVIGPQGGDVTHGNGFQMAQRIRQCAANVGVQISRNNYMEQGDSIASASQLSIVGSCPSATSEESHARLLSIAYQEHGQKSPGDLGQFVSHGPDDPVERGTPSFCTSLEMIIESAHSYFWEVSMHDSTVRSDVSRGIGGVCTVDHDRSGVTCKIARSDQAASVNLKTRLESCLSPTEWVKSCSDSTCNLETFRHPNDSADHPTISLASSEKETSVQIASPMPRPHEHDMPGYKAK